MTVKEYTAKKLKELQQKQSKDQILKTGKEKLSNADKELTTKFYQALAGGDLAYLKEVNDSIMKDYKAKAQSVGTIGSGTSGGLLVPTTIASSIITKMNYISPMRQIATVLSDMPAQLQLPSEDTMATAYWVDEGAPVTESGETLAPNMLTPWKLGGLDTFTSEVLQDAATNPSIQNFVESRFAIAMALLENIAFVNGDGSHKPYGFRSSAITPNSVAVDGDNTTYSDVIALKYSLSAAYRSQSVFVGGSSAIQALENVKDNFGRPIWREGLTENEPSKLVGRPTYLIDEIPDDLGVSTDATELWYGYFKNYFIGDHGPLRIDYGTNGTDFANDKITLRMLRRVAGRPVIGESFSKLTGVK